MKQKYDSESEQLNGDGMHKLGLTESINVLSASTLNEQAAATVAT